MHSKTFILKCCSIFIVFVSLCGAYINNNNNIEERINNLLSTMTIEEKVGQLSQIDFGTVATEGKLDLEKARYYIVNKHVGSFLNVQGNDAKTVQEIATNETSLKIPLLLGKDAIHGHALYPNGTVFPMPLGLASSFDDEIMRKSASVTATEMVSTGLNWNFSPILDVARDPRWGRIIETFGEDPYLVYRMGLAKINGYQGNNLSDKYSVLATGKHFVAYSETIGGRDYSSADISDRTLYDIFLPPFKGIVDNGVASIMTSFNDINGIPATGNVDLVRRTLKDQWNFNGIVISDYNSVAMLYHTQFVAENDSDAAKMAINAGVDVEMTSMCYLDNLVKLVNSGEVSMELLDDAVRRVLRAKFRLGLFDGKKTVTDEDILNNEEHKKVALEAARKTLVLLKNENNILPQNIDDIKKIAVIGPLADDAQNQLGGWTMNQPRQNVKTVLDGIKSVVGNKAQVVYAKGVNITEGEVEGVSSGGGVEDLGLGTNMSDASIEEAVNIAKNSDIIVAVMGEAAEMSSEPNSRAYLNLPGRQEDLLKALHATGIPIVLILINGRPLTINWEAENIPAIIEAWFPGQEGGLAIAEAIFGKINPSGKLPVTFPKTIGQIPLWYYHAYQKNWGGQESYGNRYVDIEDEPLFPFGYGLSYTIFDYNDLKTDINGDLLQISFNVKNIGNLAGTEIAQLYIRDAISSLVPFNKKLYRFKRINLQPGETKSVTFNINKSELAILNSEGRRVVEPGEFNILVGSSSSDIKLEDSIYF